MEKQTNTVLDECRISILDSQLFITSYKEIKGDIVFVIKDVRSQVLKELNTLIPCCVDFGVFEQRIDKQTVNIASVLAIAVSIKHNTIDELCELSTICETIHQLVLDNLLTEIQLKNVNKDLKKFYE